MTDPNLVAKAIGVAYLVLPVIGAWALIRELLFGARTERLAKILEAEGGLPEDTLPRTPAGRIIREAADVEFEKYRAEAEAAPEDWRSWFRLSCAYDAAGRPQAGPRLDARRRADVPRRGRSPSQAPASRRFRPRSLPAGGASGGGRLADPGRLVAADLVGRMRHPLQRPAPRQGREDSARPPASPTACAQYTPSTVQPGSSGWSCRAAMTHRWAV